MPKLLHSLLPTAATLDASGCLLSAKGSDGGGMACEQMKYMAASPPTASLIICSVVYTRKKYTDIGKSFTVIPVSGGLWKTLAVAGPWQNKVLKYSEPAYAFVTDGRKNKVEYISKTENMNIKRAKPEALCCTN